MKGMVKHVLVRCKQGKNPQTNEAHMPSYAAMTRSFSRNKRVDGIRRPLSKKERRNTEDIAIAQIDEMFRMHADQQASIVFMWEGLFQLCSPTTPSFSVFLANRISRLTKALGSSVPILASTITSLPATMKSQASLSSKMDHTS